MSNDAPSQAQEHEPPWGNDINIEVWQDGEPVAWIDAPDEPTATREALHYAVMYGQDGPVALCRVTRVNFDPFAYLADAERDGPSPQKDPTP